jgi:hypothetical protein
LEFEKAKKRIMIYIESGHKSERQSTAHSFTLDVWKTDCQAVTLYGESADMVSGHYNMDNPDPETALFMGLND